MTVNPSKRANESFGTFISNSIGDPYVDPGKYSLRSSSASKPFLTSANKKVRKSEYEHMSAGKPVRNPTAMKTAPGGFYNRKTSEPFTNGNGIGYVEDPYERKEDFARDDYARLNSKILYKGQPFSNVVKQHGTFYPHQMTYGCSRSFPEKPKAEVKKPRYGVFTRGDPAHVGHNKTFGGNGRSTEYAYVEEREEDPVLVHKNTTPSKVWRQTGQMSKSMMNSSVQHNNRNVSLERSQIFAS